MTSNLDRRVAKLKGIPDGHLIALCVLREEGETDFDAKRRGMAELGLLAEPEFLFMLDAPGPSRLKEIRGVDVDASLRVIDGKTRGLPNRKRGTDA